MARDAGERMKWTLRKLVPDDTEACVALRREMLLDEPAAFSSSPESDRGSDPALVRARLSQTGRDATFGVFAPALVGTVGVMMEPHPKASHRVWVWGMYVQPAFRRRGIGRALMEAVLSHARSLSGVTQVNLSASATMPAAQALYRAVGFRVWGEEPRAMRLDGRYLGEVHMLCVLEHAGPEALRDRQ